MEITDPELKAKYLKLMDETSISGQPITITKPVDYIAHQRDIDAAIQTLEKHLLDVAKFTKLFAAKIGLEAQGELIGLLHDLGKYSKEFQDYLQSAVGLINPDEDAFVDAIGLKGKVDHSTAGAQAIWCEFSQKGQMGEIAGQILALCIASHHSGLIDCLSSDSGNPVKDKFSERMSKPENKAHLQEVLNKMDASVSERFRYLADDPNTINNLIESVKKLINPNEHNETLLRFKIGLLVRFLFSCLIDADRLDTADFENPTAAKMRLNGQYTDFEILIDRLEKKLLEFNADSEVNKLRGEISNHCRESAYRNQGIFTLSVPTGGGKTLASLRFALHHAKKHNLERIIYVVPFTSIIDQNADESRKILESPGNYASDKVVLEHHSNLTPEEQTWKDKILTENWDAPILYTTSVQFLECLFGAGTRGARRMHQLSKAVIIFDEIQTLPINCVHVFCNAINFLIDTCGSSVVLCTATQPLLNEVDKQKGALPITIEDNEIMPNVNELFRRLNRVEVINQCKVGGWSYEEIASLTVYETKESGSCLVIVNTKAAAKMLYRLCKQQLDASVYHLSTDMCPAHRKIVLARIRKHLDGNEKVVCISTQLIEAGVDVDFGSVIRFIAGLDSIAQAAGRCNRNG